MDGNTTITNSNIITTNQHDPQPEPNTITTTSPIPAPTDNSGGDGNNTNQLEAIAQLDVYKKLYEDEKAAHAHTSSKLNTAQKENMRLSIINNTQTQTATPKFMDNLRAQAYYDVGIAKTKGETK